MKNPRSSSQDNAPWYRQAWPWGLIAGPLFVVVASLATAVVAYRTDDGVVEGDYYKRGLLVNQRLPKEPVPVPHFAASVVIDEAGRVRVHPEAGDLKGDFLRVVLAHPASGERETVTLTRAGHGDFEGVMRSERTGRWTIGFESLDWPLPTTLIERSVAHPSSVRVATSPSIR